MFVWRQDVDWWCMRLSDAAKCCVSRSPYLRVCWPCTVVDPPNFVANTVMSCVPRKTAPADWGVFCSALIGAISVTWSLLYNNRWRTPISRKSRPQEWFGTGQGGRAHSWLETSWSIWQMRSLGKCMQEVNRERPAISAPCLLRRVCHWMLPKLARDIWHHLLHKVRKDTARQEQAEPISHAQQPLA